MIRLSEVLSGTTAIEEEFKREAVKLARQPGASKAGIARVPNTLQRLLDSHGIICSMMPSRELLGQRSHGKPLLPLEDRPAKQKVVSYP